MSTEESPAQQAARLRRERREAKIKNGGSARLDKITSLSGRTPASAREDICHTDPVPSSQPPRITPSPQSQPQAASEPSPDTIRQQQEYIRSLLRANPEQERQQQNDEDPMIKLLTSMMGGVPGAESTGSGSGMGLGSSGAAPSLSPADLTNALGLPPIISKILLGGQSQPTTPKERRRQSITSFLHIIFALIVGVYLLSLVSYSVTTYGASPPPPATARNPFLVFLTGELVLCGLQVWIRPNGQVFGLSTLSKLFQNFVRDGRIVIFLLGAWSWWSNAWTA